MNEKYYTVITAVDFGEFLYAVNSLIEGDPAWKPAGGVSIQHGVLSQAMYREPVRVSVPCQGSCCACEMEKA